MNKLVGEQLSIATPKAQTTRHRIMGILNSDTYQIVYSDTPGILEPKYALHEAMMNYVKVSLEDADLILLVVELGEKYDALLFDRFKKIQTPILLVLNKIDQAKGTTRYMINSCTGKNTCQNSREPLLSQRRVEKIHNSC
jgi:GTP-binding protein Era